MTRILDPPVSEALVKRVVSPVVIVWLDILGDNVYGWNGPGVFAPVATGDPELDGNLFLPPQGPVSISDIIEDQGIGEAITILIRGDPDTEPVFQQFIVDKRPWQGRRAKIWLGLLDEPEAALVGNPFNMIDGVMTLVTLHQDPRVGSLFSVVIDADLQKASGIPARLIDHQRFYPADTASERLIRLAQGPITGAASFGPGFGIGGGGTLESRFGFLK